MQHIVFNYREDFRMAHQTIKRVTFDLMSLTFLAKLIEDTVRHKFARRAGSRVGFHPFPIHLHESLERIKPKIQD